MCDREGADGPITCGHIRGGHAPESADGGDVTNLSQKNLTKGVEWSRSGQRTPGC